MSDASSTVPHPATSAIDKKTYARLNVMVVEDAGHMSSLVCGILKSLGVGRIYEARIGSDALDILASQTVDMILIDDLQRPYDGLTVVREVRKSKSPITRSVPIIHITFKLNKSAIFAARDAGVTEILSKPFSAAQMITRIEMALAKPRALVKSEDFVGPDRRRREKVAAEHRRSSDKTAQ